MHAHTNVKHNMEWLSSNPIIIKMNINQYWASQGLLIL